MTVTLFEAIKGLSHLAFLDLSKSFFFEEKWMTVLLGHLSSVTSLTRLDLSEVVGFMLQGPCAFSQAMEQLVGLKRLDMHALLWNQQSGAAITSKLVPDLRHLRHLRHINVSDCSLGHLDALSLAESLPSQSALSHLDLSQNSFDRKLPGALVTALSCLVSLQYLNVSWVLVEGIADGAITEEDLESLGRSLMCLTSLRQLEMGSNNLEDGVSALAPTLGQLTALTSLGLGENELGHRDIATLAPSLARLTC
jgi:Ran GTPase-activating protein (RanGAP) involved in mRNA processing and transport